MRFSDLMATPWLIVFLATNVLGRPVPTQPPTVQDASVALDSQVYKRFVREEPVTGQGDPVKAHKETVKAQGDPVISQKEPVKAQKKPVKTPVKEPVKTPAKEPVKTPVKQPVKTPVKETATAPVKETAKTPAKEPVKTPVKETAEIPVKENAEIPVKEPVDAHVKEPAQTHSEESVQAHTTAAGVPIKYSGMEKQPVCNANILYNCTKPAGPEQRPCETGNRCHRGVKAAAAGSGKS